MLKILQVRLQQYVNFQMFKLDLGKAEEPEIKLPTSPGSLKKQESSRKTSISALLTMPKPCVYRNKLWQILQEMEIPGHLTCLLRNLYAVKEAAVSNGHGTIDWFQIRKEVRQGCILSPCLFNLYAEYIMRNAGLDEVQAGLKIAGRNIYNLRYADDTTLMAEREERKSLLMKVKEKSEKVELKFNIQKTKTMASGPITSWQIDGMGNNGNSDRLYFLELQNHSDGDCNHGIKRRLLFGRKVMTNLYSMLKSRDITLPTKVHLVKAMVFSVVTVGL